MAIPLKRVAWSTSALAIVAVPSIVAAQAAAHHGQTRTKTVGPDDDNATDDDTERDTRSANLWFGGELDSHRGAYSDGQSADASGGNTPMAPGRPETSATAAPGSVDNRSGDDSSTTSDDPTTVTTRSLTSGPTSTTRATTTTTSGSSPTTRGTTTSTRATTSTTRWVWPWLTTTRPATTTTAAGGTTTTTRATTSTTRATTTTTGGTPTTATTTTTTTTTTTRPAGATIRLSQTFLATAIGNPIQLNTSISNDAATPAAITLTIKLTTTGDLPGYLNPSSKPAYLSCSPAEIQNPSTTGTFTCTGSVPAATTGAVVISSGSKITGTAGTPVSSTGTAGGVSTSAASTYS